MHTIETLRESFIRQLPELEAFALGYFRHCRERDVDEALQGTRALAWKYWRQLAERGRTDDESLLRSVWYFCMRQQRAGRTITGGNGQRGRGRADVFDKRLVAVTDSVDLQFLVSARTPVPDQVAYRLDVPCFLATLTERQQGIALDLAMGMGTGEVAQKWGVSAGAISQFRTRFKLLFEQFYNDAA
jgi:hypothetical protein